MSFFRHLSPQTLRENAFLGPSMHWHQYGYFYELKAMGVACLLSGISLGQHGYAGDLGWIAGAGMWL